MRFYEMVFSPTGGTKRAADALSAALAEEAEFVDLSAADEPRPQFSAEDVCLIAVPSFGGRVPACAAERISAMNGHGARAVLMVVYGNRAYEDTLVELQDAARAAGFRTVAAVAAVAEHSIVRQFASGRPDESDILELKGYAGIIRTWLAADMPPVLELPGSRPYKERGVSALRPAAEEGCVGCGVCVTACPVGALSAEEPALPGKDGCIACMRCVSVCPQQVRRVSEAALQKVVERLAPLCSERKANELFL